MTHGHDRSKINRALSRINVLQSQVDRLEGKIEALLQTVYDHARKIEVLEDKVEGLSYGAREHQKKIEKLQVKQVKLDGLRSNLS